MALRFRTRLNLTIATLVFLVITGMTMTQIGIMIYDTWATAWTKGNALTQLTSPNIATGMTINDNSLLFVEDQMIFQALLAAELIELSEQEESATVSDISESLSQVLDRAKEENVSSIITEFNITDSTGKTIISTENSGIEFDSDSDSPTQTSEFKSLLLADAFPVRQELQPRDSDGTNYKYVGVSGIRHPRIVQVGSDESAYGEIAKNFSTQRLLERYMLEDEYRFMMITDVNGVPLAQVMNPDKPVTALKIKKARQFIADFMKDIPDELEDQFSLERFSSEMGFDIGVVTALPPTNPDDEYNALFVLHDASNQAKFIGDRISVLFIIGAVLFILGIITSIILSRGLSKPLYELGKGAREFGKGNLNYRLRLKRKDEFNSLAQSFNTMAISIQEYMHELEQETSQRERLESEFRIAAEMQQMLLPDAPPVVRNLELRGFSKTSKSVGGDFYDFLELEPGIIAVVLGDATGKGVPAALLTTQCASILRTLASDTHDPATLLGRTNTEFHKRIGTTHRFVTLFLMIIDTHTGQARYASSGHPPPVYVSGSNGEAKWLTSEAGFPLGIMEQATYHEVSMDLSPGDTLLIYSDGYTDAQNLDSEFFGETNLYEAFLKASTQSSTEEIFQSFQSQVDGYMNGREATDDMTLVIARYTG